jgi:hypothetical protein
MTMGGGNSWGLKCGGNKTLGILLIASLSSIKDFEASVSFVLDNMGVNADDLMVLFDAALGMLISETFVDEADWLITDSFLME